MRPGEEEDRQRAGRDVGRRPAADRNERAEPLGEDAERGRDDDADRPEVRPRLTDDARRGIARHGLVREETRIDPVAEVRDVVAAQQRREPTNPCQAPEVRNLLGDRRLDRVKRPRLDQEDPVDRAVDGEAERILGRLAVSPEDADDREQHGTRDEARREEPAGERPPGQGQPDHHRRGELRGEVPAGQGDLGRDGDRDSGPRQDVHPTGPLAAACGGEHDRRDQGGRKRDPEDLDIEPADRGPGAGHIGGERRDSHRQERRGEDGDARRDHQQDDGPADGRPRTDLGLLGRPAARLPTGQPIRDRDGGPERHNRRGHIPGWPDAALANGEDRRADAEEDRLQGQPGDRRMPDLEARPARRRKGDKDRGDEGDHDGSRRDDGHREGSATSLPIARAASAMPPRGSRAESHA